MQVSWQRVRIANALARTGHEWTEMLKTNNSGTYNNQYMVRACNCYPLIDCAESTILQSCA